MGKTNHTSSGYTPVQVGRVVPADEAPKGKAAPPKEVKRGTTTNIRSGNAKVGRQADTVTGNVTIVMPR